MERIVDARGLSCPEPVLMTLKEIKKGKGEIIVLVDTEVSKENVLRAVRKANWKVVEERKEGSHYRITIRSE